MDLRVRKRSGELIKFRHEKVHCAITKAAEASQESIDIDRLVQKVILKIKKQHVPVIAVEEIQDCIEDELVKNNLTHVARSFMLYRQRRQEERDAKKAILGKVIKTDLSLNAIKLLHDRYLLRDDEGEVIESPDQLFNRVASAVAEAEKNYLKTDADKLSRRWKLRFKRAMQNLDFLPSTTILVNAGIPNAQLAASCALPIKDHLEDIFQTLRNAVNVQRHGAGTGFNFSQLRERFANVHQHRRISGGPIQFMNIYADSLGVIMQNGRRNGANMGILSVDHPDILDFIGIKNKDGTLSNFNISVGLTEEFMKAAVLDQDYELKSPINGEPIKRMNAKQVLDIIIANAWNQADPGILFMDKINQDAPLPEQPIKHTSPCAEFMLQENECGIIGSINLANFVKEKEIDYKRLRDIIFLAIRFLDDVIDVNQPTLEESRKVMQQNRKIGLGVMGLAHMLFQLRISYNSEEAIPLVTKLAKFIRSVADEASFELAQERGAFPAWQNSRYAPTKENPKGFPLRNATRTAISPTGSISIIADTSSGIEPVFALSYIRKVVGGNELSYIDKYLKEALEEEGILTNELIEKIVHQGIQNCEEIPASLKDIFLTTHQVTPEAHVRMQAAFQEYIDNGVSKTVNLPYDATLLDVENVFFLAYKLGCKGVTVYRDGSKENQILEFTALMHKKRRENKRSVREELKALFANKSLDEFSQ